MSEDQPGDDNPRDSVAALYSEFCRSVDLVVRRVNDLLREEYREFKRVNRRRFYLLRETLYHSIATGFVMVMLIAVSTAVAFVGVGIANIFGGTSLEKIGVHILFFGLTGIVAVGYVYVARLGFWVRRMLIDYWETHTLPFPDDVNDGPLAACEVESVSEDDWTRAKTYCWNHLGYTFIAQIVGFWGLAIVMEFLPGLEDSTVLNGMRILAQVFAVLLGGLPAVVGLVFTIPGIPFLNSMSEVGLLMLITAVFIPALLLTVFVRNVAYKVEVRFHREWEDAHILKKISVVGYLLLVGYASIQEFFPEVISV